MKHFWLIAAVLSVLVMMIAVGIWLGFGSSYAATKSGQPQASGQATTNTDQSVDTLDSHSDGNANESMMRQQQQRQSITQLIQNFQKKSGNLNQLMTQLQQHCEIKECQQLINQVVANYPDQQFAKTLAQLLERLPAYENAMQAKIMSTRMTPQQRYEEIWKLREQMLGQQEAELAFGEEKEFASYQFAYGDLLTRAPQMTQQQRLSELAQLQQQHQAVSTTIDGQGGSYDKAVKLALIGVTDPKQQQQITQQMRARYFSPQEAIQLAEREQQVNRQQQQVQSYQSELAILKQDMNERKQQLSDSAWQQQYQLRLEQLRQKHFN